MTDIVPSTLDAATISAIVDERHGDPFAVLGPNEIAALGHFCRHWGQKSR